MEMKLCRAPWIRRQHLATLHSHFLAIPPSNPLPLQLIPRSYVWNSINLRVFTRSLSADAFSHGRFFSVSASGVVRSSQFPAPSGVEEENVGVPVKRSKVLLKGMRYRDLEKWVQSHGYRPGQALMLWKRLYGNNIWAQCIEELEGLNKDFKRMLSVHAEFKALNLKDILTASDGTKKEVTDIIYIGRWNGDRNCRDSLP